MMLQRFVRRSYLLVAAAIVPLALALDAAYAAQPFNSANPAAASAARHRLQLEQQQGALDLNLQQSLRGRRADLSAADQRRLDQLQLQQRMEQTQLENDQLQRSRLMQQNPAGLPHGAVDGRLAVERETFAQERQLQLQRFDLDQQRLLESARRPPLQPVPQPGQLNLP